MSKLSQLGHRLYTGEVSYDFIGRRRRWYILSGVLILLSLAGLLGRGLSWGIEFSGGADFKANTQVTSTTVPAMRTALEQSGVPNLREATINTIGNNQVRVQTRTLDPVDEVPKVRGAIAKEVGGKSDQVAYSLIGASWGGQITQRALLALGVFLFLVTLVIWAYFRNGKMSAAALIALGHDLILTVGVYALVGFTVTPATLIGVLTILGYSLYDTVVVFDKIRENVRDLKSSTVRTYSEAANLAVNQVLVRSINTTLIGVLPVAALLFAGAVILGEGPLKDLALALFVGMLSGAYSSIFIATPILAQLKEREPEMQKLSARVATRRAKGAVKAGPTVKTRVTSVQADAAAGAGKRKAHGATSLAVLEAESTAGQLAEVPTQQQGLESDDDPAPDSGTRGSTEGRGPRRPPTVTVSSEPTSIPGSARPVSDGAAKRPQPQHKPRSQRKK